MSMNFLWTGLLLAGLAFLVLFVALLGAYFESLRKKSNQPRDPASDKHDE